MTIGEKIKELRLNKGITQEQLTNELNCYQHNVSYWETNKGEPSLKYAILLADFFNVRLDELCCRDKKHGEWIYDGYRFRCSICDSCIPKDTTDKKSFVNETYKYCRWCGAKMGGG